MKPERERIFEIMPGLEECQIWLVLDGKEVVVSSRMVI